MKILANDGISALGKTLLEAAGHIVVTDKVEQVQLASAINEQGFDAVLVRSATTVRQEVIDACPNLKLIGRGGVGMKKASPLSIHLLLLLNLLQN